MTTKDYSRYNPRTRHLYVARDAKRAARRKSSTRKATVAEKARYASRAVYTPRASSGTVGVPSWTRKPLGTRKSVTTYRLYNTPTYYFKRYNTVYRWDTRNKRIYLLDNGLMSGGVRVPMSTLPQWVKNSLW